MLIFFIYSRSLNYADIVLIKETKYEIDLAISLKLTNQCLGLNKDLKSKLIMDYKWFIW